MYQDIPTFSHPEINIAERKVPDYAAHLVATSIPSHEKFLELALSVIDYKNFASTVLSSPGFRITITVMCLRVPSEKGNPEGDKLALSVAKIAIGLNYAEIEDHNKFLVTLDSPSESKFFIGNVVTYRASSYFLIDDSSAGGDLEGVRSLSPISHQGK